MGSPYLIKAGLSESAPGLKCSDIIPDRSYPNVYGAGEGLLAFIRKTICPEANFNVKREMRIVRRPRRPALKTNCHSRRSPSFPNCLKFPQNGTGQAAKTSATESRSANLPITGGVYRVGQKLQ